MVEANANQIVKILPSPCMNGESRRRQTQLEMKHGGAPELAVVETGYSASNGYRATMTPQHKRPENRLWSRPVAAEPRICRRGKEEILFLPIVRMKSSLPPPAINSDLRVILGKPRRLFHHPGACPRSPFLEPTMHASWRNYHRNTFRNLEAQSFAILLFVLAI